MKQATKPLPAGPNWTFGDITDYMDVISEVAEGEFGLTVYPNQIEVVSAEQMIDAYTFTGLPVCYHHWRYGKHYESWYEGYSRGRQGLAYEMVINSNPCISYFMEENNLVTQALVAAHACFGHNAFFKNNYLFKEWTHADAIVDYALFARDYIKKCEAAHGVDAVESILDAAHALEHHGIDKYKRPSQLSSSAEKALQEKRMEERYKEVYHLWNTLPDQVKDETGNSVDKKFPPQPHENILYFIEKYSPILEEWQREIVRIVRKFAQYFYPQSQTKIMNEGYASYFHYTIIYRLWELGYITDGFMQSFIDLHTRVVRQPAYNECGGMGGLNPYHVGFHTFREIERICKNPTAEDKKWFPKLVGENWLEQIKYAAYNYKDESFIAQYLTPKYIRDERMFVLLDDSGQENYNVVAISDDEGYKDVRQILSKIYNRSYQVPDLQVTEAKLKGDRRLTLQHYSVNEIPLDEKDKLAVMKEIKTLWGFDVQIFSDAHPKKPYSEDDYYVWI